MTLSEIKGSVGSVNAIAFSKYLLWSMTFFFLPIMLANIGLSGLEIGVLFSALTAMNLLSAFPIGVINDRIDTKHIITLGLVLLAAYYFMLSFVVDFWLLLILFMIAGIGNNFVGLTTLNLAYKGMEPHKGGRKLGKYHMAVSFGSGFGLLIGGTFLFNLDFSGTLLLTAIVFVPIAITSLFIGKTGKSVFPMVLYKDLLFRKKVLLFLIPLTLWSLHWGAEQVSYSLFLLNNLGLDLITSGFYMGIPIIVLALFTYYAGKSIDKGKKPTTIFLLGLLVSSIGHILMAIPVLPVSFLFRIIHEIGDALFVVSSGMIIASLFPKKTIGGNAGIIRVVSVIGGMVGAVIFSPIGFAWGFEWPLIITGVIGLFSVIPILILIEYNKKHA